jgi:predicted RNA-binding Zn-ribbon protein involved in translation (DUF1610 family)
MTPFYQDKFTTLYHGNCKAVLKTLADCSIDSCVTDPPYELTQRVVDTARCPSCNWTGQGKTRFNKGPCPKCGIELIRERQHRGGGFMGKEWDATGITFDVEMWSEVLRVLKPGAFLLAFCGTRTYHRMACAVEDAGFEIRDCLSWLYGSGFPKSLSVPKATQSVIQSRYENATCLCLEESQNHQVDSEARSTSRDDARLETSKADEVQRTPSQQATEGTRHSNIPLQTKAGQPALCDLRDNDGTQAQGCETIKETVLLDRLRERGTETQGHGNASLRQGMEEYSRAGAPQRQDLPSMRQDTKAKRGGASGSSSETIPIRGNKPSIESNSTVRKLPSLNGSDNDSSIEFDPNRNKPREIILDDYSGRQKAMAWVCSWCGLPDKEWLNSLAPLGTALKPAHELIVLARKPLSEPNVAANVLRWRTGGLNIDACRIAGKKPQVTQGINNNPSSFNVARERRLSGDPSIGRWPSNVIFSHDPNCNGICVEGCPVRELDRQSGQLTSGGGNKRSQDAGMWSGKKPIDFICESDTGGASRFFHIAERSEDDLIPFLYVAKASRAERDKGLENVEPKEEMRLRSDLTPEQREYVMAELAKAGVSL